MSQNASNIPANMAAPDTGLLLEEMLRLKSVTRSELSRRMGLAPRSITDFCQRPSLKFATLWEVCVALKHNLFADLAARFPYPPEADNPLQKHIDDLERELAIYKNLLQK